MTIKQRDLGYDFIRFTAMMMIVIHHLMTTFGEKHYYIPELLKAVVWRGQIGFGGVGVALFFMLSGALLIKNYKESFSLKTFYGKRFMKIEIPQMIGFVCAFALMYCLNENIASMNKTGLLVSLLGINYAGIIWNYFNIPTLWAIGEWFTAVIIICYVLFPLLRIMFIKYRWLSTFAISTIFLLNLKYTILTGAGGTSQSQMV